MSLITENIQTAPFPDVPESYGTGPRPGPLYLRSFGLLREDLRYDFHRAEHPALITELLCVCTLNPDGLHPDKDFILGLTVGKRMEALVRLATLGGPNEITMVFRCNADACRDELEVQVSTEEISGLQAVADRLDFVTVKAVDNSIDVKLRLPTGQDQQRWRAMSFSDEEETTEVMVRSLIISDGKDELGDQSPLSEDQLKLIDSAMNELDRLTAFSITTRCPSCRSNSSYRVDLSALALRLLERAQRRLLKNIHSLASHYHWSEEEIFSVPARRRLQYLDMIEKSGGI